MNFLKANECLLWTLSHVKPAKVYISFQAVALVHTCISLRYLKKCLWLKILSNKIIQEYNRHCKTIIISGIDIILIFFWKMNKMNFGFHKFRVIWLWVAIEILFTENWSLFWNSHYKFESLNAFLISTFMLIAFVYCFKNIFILQYAFRLKLSHTVKIKS